MKVRRHFNLDRIGRRFDSIEIEVETATIDEAIREINEAWKTYCKAIVDGAVE
jgi:hypothetical protein